MSPTHSPKQTDLIATPWKAEYDGAGDWVVWGSVSTPDANGMTVQPAICTLSSSCGEEEAHLIAAAPELLAVAIKSHEPYEGLSDQEVIDLYGGEEAALCLALRAALSKARPSNRGEA